MIMHHRTITVALEFFILVLVVTATISNPESDNPYVKALCQDTCDCACGNGPYIFERSDNDEGLGSFIQRIRLFILLDMGSGYSWIPRQNSPGHMKMLNLHRTWWQDLLGFRYRKIDCNECSMYRNIMSGRLQAIAMDDQLKQINKRYSKKGGVGLACADMVQRGFMDSLLTNSTALLTDKPKDVVLTWTRPHLLGVIPQPACTVTWMENLYKQQYDSDMRLLAANQPPLVVGRRVLPFDTNKHMAIGIHYRMGDALTSKRPDLRVGLGGHDLDKKIADTLATVVSKTQRKENLFVFITCECDATDISLFMDMIGKAGAPIHFIKSSADADVARDIDLLAHADLMFVSSSSFSVLSAALNTHGLGVVFSGNIKYTDWGRERKIHRDILLDDFWKAYKELEDTKTL